MDMKRITSYELMQENDLEDLKTKGLVLKHKKSGARIIVMQNDDYNKVFCIGFRTPPSDSTGVAHILEHSVLCGSKAFPAKDPFVELAKGSLNTFLNAMTYSDKTIYPVASCNNKDFQNLMHVYLDAVFYPNIYKRKEIFKQEGWHYELLDEDSELIYNGVVYNEMKGAFSSPEQLLFRKIQQSLFPDTAYGTESGGDPEFITDLTYEEFLNFHSKYYHPSNSYIYLYGDMDIEEKLNWIDENYLSNFDEIDVDSKIHLQKSFEQANEIVEYYSIANNESEKDNTYLSYNLSIGSSLDKELYLAMQVIEYALLSAPAAPLKQALIDAGIGKDILSSYDNGILQPTLSIIAKNTDSSKKEEFLKVIRDTLYNIVNNGMDKKSLEAAINYYEFKYREADFGRYPKGLMYGIQIFDSWLYDDNKPFIHIGAIKTFAFLKDSLGTNYFERLIEKELLNNRHESIVIIKPKKGLTSEIENKIKEKLSIYKNSLSKDEIIKLIEDTKKLKQYQEEPSTKEEIESIPLLSREDIDKKAQPLNIEKIEVNNIRLLYHQMFTNGIGYLKLLFDTKQVPSHLVPYISIFTTALGYVDTENYKLQELANEVNINTGGISTYLNLYSLNDNAEKFSSKLCINVKVLYEKINVAFELIKEIIFNSKLDDEKRLYEIIAELKSRYKMQLNSAGHTAAMRRAMSYCSPSAYYSETTEGISFYKLLEDLEQNFEEKKSELIANLKALSQCIIKKDNLLASYTSGEKGYNYFINEFEEFLEVLDSGSIKKGNMEFPGISLNEGFKYSGKIQYVARTGNFVKAGFKYTGALKVLNVILSYDYLWNNIRVKGGAYGCMCGFSRDGNAYFTSYRDPNLRETNEIYDKVYDYVKNFTADERDMTKYIIGTISNLDTPLNPSARGTRSLNAYLSNISYEDIQKERNEILNVTVEDIRALAPIVKSVLDSNNICVIGNETKLENNHDMFKVLCDLFNWDSFAFRF